MFERDHGGTATAAAIGQGAVLGALAVAAGAFGAHSLELAEQQSGWWSTAVEYQMYHALALLLCGLLGERAGAARVALPGWCFFLGTVIFSGTLYAMALGAPRWLGAITPIGGTLLIVGWVATLRLARASPLPGSAAS